MLEDEVKTAWKTIYIILLAALCYGLGEVQIGRYLMLTAICMWVYIFSRGLLRSYEEWASKKVAKHESKSE